MEFICSKAVQKLDMCTGTSLWEDIQASAFQFFSVLPVSEHFGSGLEMREKSQLLLAG